ncbi:MAG: VWA domain-containing protein [Deltaproteobacteria bacterium]|nr:VWA domain-containing protein [Deltaproteobacteria bacterium]MBN2673843.1 VWA domain-containing protein [Deltaproteobacteria bacterium]
MNYCFQLLIVMIVTLLALGCSKDKDDGGDTGDNANSDSDTTGLSDGDADGDVDGDVDGDADGDADSESSVIGDDTACGQTSVDFSSAAPAAMLVIDRSGSMSQDFEGSSRWEVARRALIDPQTGFVAQLDSEIRFGLAMYAGAQNGGACPYLDGVDPALNNYPEIARVYMASEPLSNTPTAEAVRAVTDILVADPTPGNKVIILVTDGLPDTCANPNGHDAASQNSAVVAVNNAFVAGIDTYVISVGEQEESQHFQDLADAGLGVAPGEGQYYAAESQGQLVDALAQIMSDIRSCSFNLRGTIVGSLVQYCRVAINGQLVSIIHPEVFEDTDTNPDTDTDTYESFLPSFIDTDLPLLDGGFWRPLSPSQMELTGTACQAIQEGDVLVQMECPCEAFVPTDIMAE